MCPQLHVYYNRSKYQFHFIVSQSSPISSAASNLLIEELLNNDIELKHEFLFHFLYYDLTQSDLVGRRWERIISHHL